MVMTGWQPIDTAPKDGTSVLLYGIWSGEVHGSANEYSILQASFSFKNWLVEGGEYYCAYVINPTHWMPLPAPPVNTSAERVKKTGES